MRLTSQADLKSSANSNQDVFHLESNRAETYVLDQVQVNINRFNAGQSAWVQLNSQSSFNDLSGGRLSLLHKAAQGGKFPAQLEIAIKNQMVSLGRDSASKTLSRLQSLMVSVNCWQCHETRNTIFEQEEASHIPNDVHKNAFIAELDKLNLATEALIKNPFPLKSAGVKPKVFKDDELSEKKENVSKLIRSYLQPGAGDLKPEVHPKEVARGLNNLGTYYLQHNQLDVAVSIYEEFAPLLPFRELSWVN